MKQQADTERIKVKKWKKRDKMIPSMKDLVFKKRLAKKLVDQYVGLYIIDKVISTNAVKLQLLTLMRIHLVVNISWVVRYRKQVERQNIRKLKLVEIDGVEEWEVGKILNKRKV